MCHCFRFAHSSLDSLFEPSPPSSCKHQRTEQVFKQELATNRLQSEGDRKSVAPRFRKWERKFRPKRDLFFIIDVLKMLQFDLNDFRPHSINISAFVCFSCVISSSVGWNRPFKLFAFDAKIAPQTHSRQQVALHLSKNWKRNEQHANGWISYDS